MHREIKPNNTSARFMWFLITPITVFVLAVVFLSGTPVDQFGILPYIAVSFLLAPIVIQFWVKSQSLILSNECVTYKTLTSRGMMNWVFPLNNIEYWYYFSPRGYKAAGVKSLVIKSTHGPEPMLPHGPFANLKGVIILPPTFSKYFNEVINFLESKNVHQKT